MFVFKRCWLLFAVWVIGFALVAQTTDAVKVQEGGGKDARRKAIADQTQKYLDRRQREQQSSLQRAQAKAAEADKSNRDWKRPDKMTTLPAERPRAIPYQETPELAKERFREKLKW